MSCSTVVGGFATIKAFSVAKLTLTEVTPSTFFRAFSTRPTQEAQVIPSMASSIGSAFGTS